MAIVGRKKSLSSLLWSTNNQQEKLPSSKMAQISKISHRNRDGRKSNGGGKGIQVAMLAFVAIVIGLFVMSVNLGSNVVQQTSAISSTSSSTETSGIRKKEIKTNTVSSSSSETSSPYLYKSPNPPPPITVAAKSIKKKKKLTYGRFGGRLNNQLFQFVAALQMATVLNRTLIFPPEKDMVRWTGFIDNDLVDLWDFTDLTTHYDIDWTTAAEDEYEVKDENCVVKPGKYHELFTTADIERYQACEVLDVGGAGGLLFARQHHRFIGKPEHERVAFDIYQRLHPSKAVAKMVEEFEKDNPWPLAFHSRTHGEGPYPSKICVNGNFRVCRPHFEAKLHDKWCDNHTMHLDCAKWQDLDVAGQLRSSKATADLNSLYGGQKPKFVLANDMTHDFGLEFPNQYGTISNNQYMSNFQKMIEDKFGWKEDGNNPGAVEKLVAVANSPFMKAHIKKGKNEILKHVDRLSQILFEVWSLLKPKYMIGNVYSTLSLAVCIMRGENRKYNSNMCWMLLHPDSHHAAPPE